MSTSPNGTFSSVITKSGVPSSSDAADVRTVVFPGPAGTAGSLMITPGTIEFVGVGATVDAGVVVVGSVDGVTDGSDEADGVAVGAIVGSGVAVGVGSTAF
ncbi:hypothetical protein D3C76_1140500 [compost metagenome]